MADTLDDYALRFAPDREETRAAIEACWAKFEPELELGYGGIVTFSMFAVGQQHTRNASPWKVKAAELYMRLAGFEPGPRSKKGAATWKPVS